MKMILTWEDVTNSCLSIYEQLKDEQFDLIVPVVRGGMCPASLLSELFGVKRVRPVQFQTRDIKTSSFEDWEDITSSGKRVLVVDDIVDSGLTLEIMQKNAVERTNLTYCALVVNEAVESEWYNTSDIVRGITINKDVNPDIWVDFPWELSAQHAKSAD